MSKDNEFGFEIPKTIPLLPVRDIVVFPYMILPLFVGRESSIEAVREAMTKDKIIMLASQKEIADEKPSPDKIYEVGTVAMIMRVKDLPDGRVKILAQGLSKAKITKYHKNSSYYKVDVEIIENLEVEEPDIETEALMRASREKLEKTIALGKALSPDILLVVEEIKEPGKLADLIVSNLGLKVKDAQSILEVIDPKDRLILVNESLNREIEILELQNKIKNMAKDEIQKSQKDYFLKEQIKVIKSQLGEEEPEEDDIEMLKQKILKASMPKDVEKESLKQFKRLEKMHPESSESSVQRTYIDWLIELPWSKRTEDKFDLIKAKEILDEDHYDLEEVKERIVEQLAVSKLAENNRAPILCFVGPPGVGKTSLGKSIARALGREFIRISLGGVKDEAEIRGHRRTYVGAMPGRIINGLKQAGTKNPVFMLDEIDKLGADYKGDPSSALLEVLDPEQNFSFRDHYINLPFDLSDVMFVATANVLDTIPPALRDRMEIIQLAGYTAEDKVKIAKKYLIPRQIKFNGLKDINLKISDKVLSEIVMNYTRESGLRNFERLIGKLTRKIATLVAVNKTVPKSISSKLVETYLGPAVYLKEEKVCTSETGIVTGLAWTQYGGEILYVEVASSKGTGQLKLTGNLGKVMQESAMTALAYIKTNAKEIGINEDNLNTVDIYVHFPSGGIPKDGPSAGITIATAIVSHLKGLPVSKDIAMTGEISLSGKVLPIGGLKEKALAAMRFGISTVIAPAQNMKDMLLIPDEYKKKIKFIFVKNAKEVFELALLSNKEDNKTYYSNTLKAVA